MLDLIFHIEAYFWVEGFFFSLYYYYYYYYYHVG